MLTIVACIAFLYLGISDGGFMGGMLTAAGIGIVVIEVVLWADEVGSPRRRERGDPD